MFAAVYPLCPKRPSARRACGRVPGFSFCPASRLPGRVPFNLKHKQVMVVVINRAGKSGHHRPVPIVPSDQGAQAKGCFEIARRVVASGDEGDRGSRTRTGRSRGCRAF